MRKPFRRIKEYKHSGTSGWVVEGLREHGKRTRKFFKTEAEAKTWLAQKEIDLVNLGTRVMSLTDENKLMALQCIEKLKSSGKSLIEATDFFLSYVAKTERSSTVKDAVKKLLENKEADGKSKRYLGDLKGRLKRFKEDFGERNLATLETEEMDDWLRELGLSPVSRNNFRRVLNVFFNYAKDRNYSPTNPMAKTAKAKVVYERPGILTVKQMTNLLNAAPLDLIPVIAIGGFAGLRVEEISRLSWSEVNLARGLIEVTAPKSKTAKHRFVSITPNLAKWLAPRAKKIGNVKPSGFRGKFKTALEAAKIKKWPKNALRHSYASYHIAHFQNANQLALEMGHTDSGMIFEHYRTLISPEDAASYWKIEPMIEEDVLHFSSAVRA